MAVDPSVPIAAKVARTACRGCANAMHEAIRQGNKDISLLKGNHGGECTCNSDDAVAIAEEFMLEKIGTELLVDEQGNIRPDSESIFISVPTSDGDSKGSHRLVGAQAKVIGGEADGQTEDAICTTHVKKNLTKAFHKLRKNDPSLRGGGGLTNDRIMAVSYDIHQNLLHLKLESWDVGHPPTDDQVTAAADSIMNVIDHHCGDHTNCIIPYCMFLQTKVELGFDASAELTPVQEKTVYDKMMTEKEPRFDHDLELNAKGKKDMAREVTLRYNKITLPKLSRCITTAQSELLWSIVTKYSQGKRLNQNYSRAWEVAIALAILQQSDPSHYDEKLFKKLGLLQNDVQKQFQKRNERIRSSSKRYRQSEKAILTKKWRKTVKRAMSQKSSNKKRYS